MDGVLVDFESGLAQQDEQTLGSGQWSNGLSPKESKMNNHWNKRTHMHGPAAPSGTQQLSASPEIQSFACRSCRFAVLPDKDI